MTEVSLTKDEEQDLADHVGFLRLKKGAGVPDSILEAPEIPDEFNDAASSSSGSWSMQKDDEEESSQNLDSAKIEVHNKPF